MLLNCKNGKKSAEDKAWKSSEGIRNIFSMYISSNGKVNGFLMDWVPDFIVEFVSYLEQWMLHILEKIRISTWEPLIILMVCLSVKDLLSDHVIMSLLYCWYVWFFPFSFIKETRPKMPYSMGLSKWTLPTLLNLCSHTVIFKANFFKWLRYLPFPKI